MGRLAKIIYISVFFIMIAVPFVFMPFYKTDMSVEKRYAQTLPKVMKDGKINMEYFEEWDSYVSDHFAFRQELSTVDAVLLSKLAHLSNTDKVIVGTDGWLYFQETLDDYLGRNVLSDREIHDCAKVAALIQEGAEEQGCSFVFTVSPNKNSLYPDNMPQRYVKESNVNNFSKLVPELIEHNVNFVNLHDAFKGEDKVMYHKLDSHWNNEGAVLACDRLLTFLDKEHTDYSGIGYHIEKNFSGDLKGMIYPKLDLMDDNVIYDKEHQYSYIGNVNSTEDMMIETDNSEASGSVIMFRDSFGNALLPYIADEYGHGFFTKAVPFNLGYIEQYDADTMILEVVERHIPTLISKVPLMTAIERDVPETVSYYESGETTIQTEDAGDKMAVYGIVDPQVIDDESDIYVEFETEEGSCCYEAFPASYKLPDEDTDLSICYGLYIDKSMYETEQCTIHVLTDKDGIWYSTGLLQINK